MAWLPPRWRRAATGVGVGAEKPPAGKIATARMRRKAFFKHQRMTESIIDQASSSVHNFARRNRRALEMTDTELRLIAAPAIIGLSSRPENG